MNNKDKYTVSKLTDAIDDAMNVSFNQMVDTVRTQCYMSQTEINWEECEELDNLGEHRKMGNVKDKITNEMKRVVISALTDSDWVSDDELAKRNPNKFRKPPNSLHLAHSLSKNKSDSRWNMSDESIKNVTLLALETLLEQVRDARDFEQIGRVKNVLDIAKSTEC